MDPLDDKEELGAAGSSRDDIDNLISRMRQDRYFAKIIMEDAKRRLDNRRMLNSETREKLNL